MTEGLRYRRKLYNDNRLWHTVYGLSLSRSWNGNFHCAYPQTGSAQEGEPIRLKDASIVSIDESDIIQLEFAFYLLQIPALLCLKLSVLFFYRRLFVGKAFKVTFWTLATISVLWALSFFIAWASLCSHFDDRFYSLMTWATKCADSFATVITQAVTDVVVDLAILFLPVPFVCSIALHDRR